jgi:hypothetical protein
MPGIIGAGSKRLRIIVLVAVLALAFTPISKVLLSAVNGSFSPTHYSSLAFVNPSQIDEGIRAGRALEVDVVNHSGGRKTYHIEASERGSLIGLGQTTLNNGQSATVSIATLGTTRGTLRIRIVGTGIFLTAPIVKS